MTFAKKRIRIICPEGGSKILFPSRASAEVYLENLKSHTKKPEALKPTRIYYCSACGGYHTSTSIESRVNRMSPKARAESLRLWRTQKYSPRELRDFTMQLESKAKNSAKIKKQPKILTDNTRTVIPGRVYRHFKGDYYRVLTTAHRTETNESLVIYQLLNRKKRKVWARPSKEFVSEVDHIKYPNARQRYRFELQGSKTKIKPNS